METMYTDERNAQIVIALLKENGIKRVVVSPGNTNVCLVASMQSDPFFELYSSVDERSAAYIACGIAAETQEPVVLSCTGATASRNYYPGLTEAFYRKLPILAITSSRRSYRIGHNFDQVTDRTVVAKDIVNISVQMPVVYDDESEWACVIACNKAILSLCKDGGGPAHINLETTYSTVRNVKEIKPVRSIKRYTVESLLPVLVAKRVAIVVGSHLEWAEQLTQSVESFAERYNAIILCDHTSNYKGKYRINPTIATHQRNYKSIIESADLVIHIGGISSSEFGIKPEQVWRVNDDGEIRDTFGKLSCVFYMSEKFFFDAYNEMKEVSCDTEFFQACLKERNELLESIPDLPFSNIWVASMTANRIPKDSVLHLGIRNSLRSWNYFDIPEEVRCYSNTGGFGIDGGLSSTVGASLVNNDKLFFCVLGDLAFFYDMNVIGNRHIGNNLRIMLINNGTGMEMRFSSFLPSKVGVDSNPYIAASGHYGGKSKNLVRSYVENLGFTYISAENKDDYLALIDIFLNDKSDKPILFEVFMEDTDEDAAYKILGEIKQDKMQVVKNTIYDALGKKGVDAIKKIVKL